MIQVIIDYSPMVLLGIGVLALSYVMCGGPGIDDDPRDHADDPFLCPYADDSHHGDW